MTPAIKLLQKQKIAHQVLEYEHDPNASSFGLEAAQKLNLPADQVFKILLATDGKAYFVAILPVDCRLSLKKLAMVVGAKKLQMANAEDAERITGYLVGGISPLAQKKRLKTVIQTQARHLECMYVSGGKRGCDVGIHPNDLAKLLNAMFADIIESA